jgi:hypothetical protein
VRSDQASRPRIARSVSVFGPATGAIRSGQHRTTQQIEPQELPPCGSFFAPGAGRGSGGQARLPCAPAYAAVKARSEKPAKKRHPWRISNIGKRHAWQNKKRHPWRTYTLVVTPSVEHLQKKPSIQWKLLIESNQIVAMRKTASRRCIRGVLMRPWGQGSERPQGRVKLPAHNPGGKATEAPIAGRGEASVTRNQ